MGMLTIIVWMDQPTLEHCKQLCELGIRWRNGDTHLISTIMSMEIQKVTITQLEAWSLLNEDYWSGLDLVLCTLVNRLGHQRHLEVEIQLVDIPEVFYTRGRGIDYLPRFRKSGGRVNFADSEGRILTFL